MFPEDTAFAWWWITVLGISLLVGVALWIAAVFSAQNQVAPFIGSNGGVDVKARLKPTLLAGCALWLCVCLASVSSGQENADFSRQALVRQMRESEKQARAAEVRYTYVSIGTKANMVPLIKAVCDSQGTPQQAANFLIDDAFLKKNSHRIHWVRKGEKERFETRPLSPDQGIPDLTIQAFNGKRVWTVTYDPVKPKATLHTVEGGHWKTGNRTHPFSFLYYFQDMPYSQIVEKSPFYELGQERVEGKTYTVVSVGHPKFLDMRFHLFLDEKLRLFQRQLLTNRNKEKQFQINETHRFLDWTAFENKEGAPIDFPALARYFYYMGETPDGTLVEYTSNEIKIEQMIFNPAISDAIFNQQIPTNAEVWDGISGLRQLAPGNRPEHLFPEDAEARWWWIKTVGISAFAILALIAVANRLRNRTKTGKTV
jgi:hypothetical protein